MTNKLLDSGAVLRLQSAIEAARQNGSITISLGISDARAILSAITSPPTPPIERAAIACASGYARDIINNIRFSGPLFPSD